MVTTDVLNVDEEIR